MVKTAVVTGGTTGIGLVISEQLQNAGWQVLTSSHRSESGADFVADLSIAGGAVRLYSDILAKLGGNPPELLVNNAGVLALDEPAAIRCINFEAPQQLTMLMAGRETGMGKVINLLDAAVLNPSLMAANAGYASYYQSKRELHEYTLKSAAMFVETLRVNAVAPGAISLPAGEHLRAGECFGGRPTREQVADAVVYLAGADAVTGVIIPIDGGASLVG